MDIFKAVFKANDDDLERAAYQFMREFGRDSYFKLIHPYIVDHPGFIWIAPRSQEIYWFLDRLLQNACEANGEEYAPPPQFIAVDPTPDDAVSCTKCGLLVVTKSVYPGDRFGIDGQICLICYNELAAIEIEQFVKKINGASTLDA
jgi:hypothetical protein